MELLVGSQQPEGKISLARSILKERNYVVECQRGVDHLIRGMMDLLPKPDTVWSTQDRAKWLRLAIHVFELGYKTEDFDHVEINIVTGKREMRPRQVT